MMKKIDIPICEDVVGRYLLSGFFTLLLALVTLMQIDFILRGDIVIPVLIGVCQFFIVLIIAQFLEKEDWLMNLNPFRLKGDCSR